MIGLLGKFRKLLFIEQSMPELFLLFPAEAITTLFHVYLAAFSADLCEHFGQPAARHGDHFHQEHGCVDAVLSVDVSAHRQSAG